VNTIAKTAKIADGVVMGVGNVIHDHAQILEGTVLGNNNDIGSFCRVGPFVTMEDSNKLDFQVALGGDPQDLRYRGEETYLTIGSHNIFREFVTAHRGAKEGDSTIIGDHNYFMAYTHVGHDSIIGNHCNLSNYVGLSGHTTMEDHSIFGGHSGSHQFCRLGMHSMIGGMVKVNFDVPPYVLVDGIPSRVRRVNSVGLKLSGFSDGDIKKIEKFYDILYRSNTDIEKTLEALEAGFPDDPHARRIVEFCKASTRGVMRFYR
tara:strand:- start:5015 stop:5797 length:783 start_codon:yes stop_codon:yes gene_type:complete